VSARAGLLLAAVALGGCATRADLLRQDRELRGAMRDQTRQLQQVQRELERLRADMEEAGGRKTGGGQSTEDRLTALEQRLTTLEGGGPAAAEGNVPPVAVVTPPKETPPAPSARPGASAPGAAPEEDGWRREIAREQATAGSVDVAERGEYLGLMDGLARQDCARVVPQLNSFAANHKDSPLADNALYWAARCYAQKGDQNQAVSKFYDVVTKYPKGDKAAAALWAQGNLFVEMGDSPDARLAFSKLIRDYPSSEEAARARQKLSELED
jgi:tol-pal system protein YbgF